MREWELRKPVCLWLDSQGYTPLMECWSFNNCDVVGVQFAERPRRIKRAVCVELKLRDIAGVTRQAVRHVKCEYAEAVYVAMPMQAAIKCAARTETHSFGVLGVEGESVVVMRKATDISANVRPTKAAFLYRRRNEWRERIVGRYMLRADGMRTTEAMVTP